MWDLRSTWRSTDITWRSTDIDPELSPISHAIRSSDKFTTSRKPRNFNDPISKFERVVGELHAKLRWGAVFSEVSRGHRSWSSSKLVVIEAGRPQAAGTTQNNPLKTNGPKKPDPSRPSSRLSDVMVMGSGHGYRYRSGISGRGTLRDARHAIRMITILIHIHVRST